MRRVRVWSRRLRIRRCEGAACLRPERRRAGGCSSPPGLFRVVFESPFEGLTFSRACITLDACARYGVSPQFVEAVMAEKVSRVAGDSPEQAASVAALRESLSRVDHELNLAVANVEALKGELRRAQALERHLRAARGREAAAVDPRQLAIGS